jgi:predicted  nucleic acid-binding Zn-ribbon protein
LSTEKSARSVTSKALAEEKDACLTTEQAIKTSDEAKAKLSRALETTKATYVVTRDNLAFTSKELDDLVIREQEAKTLWARAEEKLVDVEKKLVAAKGEKKDQRLLLESTRKALSKHEDSSIQMISTAVANAMALLKSHLPDLDVELLRKDFAVDEVEREVLTSGAYDAAHEFASSYDFSSLV